MSVTKRRNLKSVLAGMLCAGSLLAACSPPTVPVQREATTFGRFRLQETTEPGQLISSGGNTYISGMPYVKQGNDNTCGQAVATMLLQYWGQDVDYQTVVNESNPLNVGTSYGALQAYLQQRGLQAQGYRDGSLEILLALIRRGRPVIALLDFGGLNWEHYVVVIGYNESRNTLIFHDSSNGPYLELDAETFVARWANPSLVNLPLIGGSSYRYLMFDVNSAAETSSEGADE